MMNTIGVELRIAVVGSTFEHFDPPLMNVILKNAGRALFLLYVLGYLYFGLGFQCVFAYDFTPSIYIPRSCGFPFPVVTVLRFAHATNPFSSIILIRDLSPLEFQLVAGGLNFLIWLAPVVMWLLISRVTRHSRK